MHDYMGQKWLILSVLYVVVPLSRQKWFSEGCDWCECHSHANEIVLIVWHFHKQCGTGVSGDSSGTLPLELFLWNFSTGFPQLDFVQNLTFSRLCAILHLTFTRFTITFQSELQQRMHYLPLVRVCVCVYVYARGCVCVSVCVRGRQMKRDEV